MAWPVPGARRPTAAKLQWGNQRSPTHVHNGLDIPAPEGTVVVAARGGLVEHASAQWMRGFSGYGAHVVVAVAGGERDLYAHLGSVGVEPGDYVEPGEAVGTVGKTAFTDSDRAALLSSGPHLHFERSPRAYPQPSEAPRLDPWPALEAEPMTTLVALSELWNRLRDAVVTRGGATRPGIAPDVANAVLVQVEAFRKWADQQGPLVPAGDFEQWERDYAKLRARLGSAGVALPDVDPDRPTSTERVLSSTASIAWGFVAIGVVYLLRGFGGKR